MEAFEMDLVPTSEFICNLDVKSEEMTTGCPDGGTLV